MKPLQRRFEPRSEANGVSETTVIHDPAPRAFYDGWPPPLSTAAEGPSGSEFDTTAGEGDGPGLHGARSASELTGRGSRRSSLEPCGQVRHLEDRVPVVEVPTGVRRLDAEHESHEPVDRNRLVDGTHPGITEQPPVVPRGC